MFSGIIGCFWHLVAHTTLGPSLPGVPEILDHYHKAWHGWHGWCQSLLAFDHLGYEKVHCAHSLDVFNSFYNVFIILDFEKLLMCVFLPFLFSSFFVPQTRR